MIEIGDFPQQDYFAPKGWVCPKCGRVYAPSTPMCWYCGGEEAVTVTNQPTTSATPKHDYHTAIISSKNPSPVTYSTTTWTSSAIPDIVHVSINSYPTTNSVCLN